MAPPPEYDKEPKAPDKSVTTIVHEVSNNLHCINDQQINSDHKPTNTATNNDIEKNKVDDAVENLDDGRLRALLDEAITYKCPKDREGKSDLFKNLLEAAEQQDDQASEAATRGLNSSRSTRVRGAGRRSLAHSNSLQDLVAALAAEPTPRRHRHPPAPAPVSARATQGGSLPSGVDTSFLLGEEPGTTRAGYLATVRCVNPPPLAERRVSASDANPPPDEAPHRRSKPVFPVTYTARATLEIGSGSVCSGRAVTTTTASNQVRTAPALRLLAALSRPRGPSPTAPRATPCHLITQMYSKTDTNTMAESNIPQVDEEPKDNLATEKDVVHPVPESKKKLQVNEDLIKNDNQARKGANSKNNSSDDEIPISILSKNIPFTTSKASSIKNGQISTCSKNNSQDLKNPQPHEKLTKKDNLAIKGAMVNNNSSDNWIPIRILSKNDSKNLAKNAPFAISKASSIKNQIPTYSKSNSQDIKSSQLNEKPIKKDHLPINAKLGKNKPIVMSKPSSDNGIPIRILSKNDSKNMVKNDSFSTSKVGSMKNQILTYSKKNPQDVISSRLDKEPIKNNNQATKDTKINNSPIVMSKPSSDNGISIRIISKNDSKNVAKHGPASTSKAGAIKKGQVPIFSKKNSHEAIVKNSTTVKGSNKTRQIPIKTKEEFTKSNLTPTCPKNELSKSDQTHTYSNRDSATQISTPTTWEKNVKSTNSDVWAEGVNNWYQSLSHYNTQGLGFNSESKVYATNKNAIPIPSPDTLMPNNSHKSDMFAITNMDDKDETDPSYNIPGLLEIVALSKNNYGNSSPKHKGHSNIMSYTFKEKESFYRNDDDSDITRLRKKYRETVGEGLVAPRLSNANPRNIRPMTISKLPSPSKLDQDNSNIRVVNNKDSKCNTVEKTEKCVDADSVSKALTVDTSTSKCDNFAMAERTESDTKKDDEVNYPTKYEIKINNIRPPRSEEKIKRKQSVEDNSKDFELVDLTNNDNVSYKDSFSRYYASHQRLFQAMEATNDDHSQTKTESIAEDSINQVEDDKDSFLQYCVGQQKTLNELKEATIVQDIPCSVNNNVCDKTHDYCIEQEMAIINTKQDVVEDVKTKEVVIKLSKNPQDKPYTDLLSELSVFLAFPKCVITNYSDNDTETYQINNIRVQYNDDNVVMKSSKKKNKKSVKVSDAKKQENMNKTALKALLFENVKSEKAKAGASTVADKKGDSAVPFSCITTPEVVASCNTTTSSTSQATVAVDPKPLQLGSCYRAVASLTGAAPAAPPPPADDATALLQPRNVISGTYNGLSLARSYGATAAVDDYKKSLDENGNAVQGFSSPVSGSSQHKKPRRKKSSKNETVITSHQIDGYQGNKDLNEVLRFIESNAEHGRGAKLARAKHKDDADDKGGKKRSAERRKDKEKVKRASSLEELSRTKLEDLTAELPRAPEREREREPKAERRSWGDDYRAPAPPAPDPPELTDFQTVTKRRKPRRRPDEPEREPPRRRPPSPAPRAPGRADSPPARAPLAPVASYADIARTRHNIPDLIESCNFYAEGEGAAPAGGGAAEADGYPALGGARARGKGAAAAAGGAARRGKERVAPDVLGERRPPVILAAAGRGARDLDGVTFGFDVNEQLLGASARRCDLLADDGAVRVRVRPPLLYRPPRPPPDTHHLHQIVDYVAHAWEDVVRCGGKARYYSE